ncbi:chymotrypsin inhibitor [Megalopta genalis]|uniref:chymotrypsin inhibitor n=1 Tax=Megalopta genalis TaxID=115081 RepID=UPI003FD24A1D
MSRRLLVLALFAVVASQIASVESLDDSSSTIIEGSPLCGVNEKWDICGRLCEPSCSSRHPYCPPLQCSKYIAGCRCLSGWLRNDQGACVRPNQCPESSEKK